MGTKSWEEIEAPLRARPDDEERMAAAHQRVAAREGEYFARLGELRKARGATQVALAERAKLTQSGVARIERQADLYVSTLRRYIEALGGQLEVRAVFPDQDIEIRFEDFAVIDSDNPALEDLTTQETPSSPPAVSQTG